MKKLSSTVALTLLGAALSTGSAAAQGTPVGPPADRSDLHGFMLGLNFNGGVAEKGPGTENEPAAGVGLTLGYGVSGGVTLFARGDYGYRSTYLDLGARYSFGGPAAALRPYVEGAITGASTSLRTGTLGEPAAERGTRATAGALSVWTGLEYFLAPNLALDLGVGYSRGRWIHTGPGDEQVRGRRDFGTPRFNLGIKWRP